MQRATRVSNLPPPRVDGVVVLDFDARQKHRFLARLEGGEELAVTLPRGSVLADGDFLETDAGAAVRVRAAMEPLSVVRASDPLLLARLTYHLGNRHVPLQIESGKLSYRHDHVLDELAARLGAAVGFEHAPFSPEGGAYGRGAHHEHHHAHEHTQDAPGHAHPHDHDHAPPHDAELSGDHEHDSAFDHDYGGEG